MTTATMAASNDGAQPCAKTTTLWHDSSNKDKADPKNWHWRDCLEALNSGDFLTPAFIGFAFHDVFRFVGSFIGWENRGTLLERSFEEQFKALIDARKGADPGEECVDGLACPFLSLRPTAERWLPFLVLNSTSVESGQRIITSMLAPTFDVIADNDKCPIEPRTTKKCPLFEYAQSFHDLLHGESGFNDVRLSTAAHDSARFPLLSPPGEIRRGHTLVDRIVDGGYFENLGAQTATELAEAMLAIDKNLKPFVLVISNDPQLRNANTEKADGRNGQPGSDGGGFERIGSVMTDLVVPVTTILNTRNARGLLAVADIPAIMDPYSAVCNVAHIQVAGERDSTGRVREVSWSWWLSKPVQIYMHEQTEFRNAPSEPSPGQVMNEKPVRMLLDAIAWKKADPSAPVPDCAVN
jgi:hypothetical protein